MGLFRPDIVHCFGTEYPHTSATAGSTTLQSHRIFTPISIPPTAIKAIPGNTVTVKGSELLCYGFYEDTVNPDRYETELEGRLGALAGVQIRTVQSICDPGRQLKIQLR